MKELTDTARASDDEDRDGEFERPYRCIGQAQAIVSNIEVMKTRRYLRHPPVGLSK